MKCVLTIAGSDSSAGAGIQSDLKTFHNHGIYGLSVITAVTSQNTVGVQNSFELPSDVIQSQLEAVFDDFKITAVKTGMLSSEHVIRTLIKFFKKRKLSENEFKLIVDPIIVSKNNFTLLNKKGLNELKNGLLNSAYLVTPNLSEAEIISGKKIRDTKDLEKAARIIYNFGCKNVLIKGGHFPSPRRILAGIGLVRGTDVLYDGRKYILFKSKYVNTRHTHGIGCTLSAAITANLALGKSLKESIILSKTYVINSLKKGHKLGNGYSPVEQ